MPVRKMNLDILYSLRKCGFELLKRFLFDIHADDSSSFSNYRRNSQRMTGVVTRPDIGNNSFSFQRECCLYIDVELALYRFVLRNEKTRKQYRCRRPKQHFKESSYLWLTLRANYAR